MKFNFGDDTSDDNDDAADDNDFKNTFPCKWQWQGTWDENMHQEKKIHYGNFFLFLCR